MARDSEIVELEEICQEMLEALEEAVAVFTPGYVNPPDWRVKAATLAKAQAAIAKATEEA